MQLPYKNNSMNYNQLLDLDDFAYCTRFRHIHLWLFRITNICVSAIIFVYSVQYYSDSFSNTDNRYKKN